MIAPTDSYPPLDIAVVGHTNVGKTSLLRTLLRQPDFGQVCDSAGTTRHVERTDLRIQGAVAVRYFDTPGLEDSVALHHYLQSLPGDVPTPLERVRAFLRGPEAQAAFEQEAKVLRKLLEADAAIYVIDCREDVLPKYRCEIEILSACAKPVMPVLNFARSPGHQAQAWQSTLAAYHLHASVLFDAVAPFVGAERQLYEDLGVLLRARRAQFRPSWTIWRCKPRSAAWPPANWWPACWSAPPPCAAKCRKPRWPTRHTKRHCCAVFGNR